MLGIPFLVNLVPKWEKWEVAILPLVLYCFNSAFASISTPLTNTLNALGKVKINTYLMIMWTTLTWILTPFLAIRFGFLGVAYATAIIAVSSIVPVIIVKNLTKFSLSKSVVNNTIAALLMLIVGFGISKFLTSSWLNLILVQLVGVIVFAGSIYIFEGPRLVSDVKGVWNVWRKK
jgi:O-antigen/teichoic acid export membrane protein